MGNLVQCDKCKQILENDAGGLPDLWGHVKAMPIKRNESPSQFQARRHRYPERILCEQCMIKLLEWLRTA